MIIKITIDKNDNDDWSITSPFSGYTSSTGFFISNDASATYGSYVLIPNVLLSTGSVNRTVDIFDIENFNMDVQLQGIGGLTKVGDWNFEIENISGITTSLNLIGRVVTLLIDDVVMYVGRIYKCDPSRKRIKFHVRSKFLLWDKQIGTIISSNIKESNNKIYPIIYGDFTTDDSYIPLLVDITDQYTIEGYLSEENLKEISNIFVWDDVRQVADQSTNDLDDITIETGNKKIIFKTDTGYILTSAITGTPDMDNIYINVMPVIGFKITGSPTFTPGELFYTDTTSYGRNYYEFVELKSDIYIFEVGKRDTDIEYFINPEYGDWDTLKPDASGTLVKVSDSSTYTVNGDNISDITVPDLFARQKGENYKSTVFVTGPPLQEGLEYDYNDPVKSNIVQIEDEKMLIYRSLPQWSSSLGMHSEHAVFRGYNNTTKATHSLGNFIYLKQDVRSNTEHFLKMKTIVPIAGLSNWKALFVVDDGTNETYKPSKTVEEMTDSVSNFDYFIHNFEYQNTNRRALLNALEVVFTNFWDLSFLPYTAGYGALPDIQAVLLLDIELGKAAKIKGYITGVWLLGSYKINHPTLLPGTNPFSGYDSKITLAMRSTTDTDNYKRVGINLYNAYLLGINPTKETIGKNNYTLNFSNLEVPKVMSHIVNYDRSWDTTYFYQYFNNPLTVAGVWEKSYSLFGSWNYITSPTWQYDLGNVQNPRMPETLEDFFKQKFVFQLHGKSQFHFYMNNVGFLVEYNVDIRETPLWFQGKGRVDISDNLLTTPVHVIEDILVDELNIHGSDIDTTSFTNAKNDTLAQTCAFALYNEPIKVSNIFKTICKEHCLILGELPNGDVYISSLHNMQVDYTIQNTDILLSADNMPYCEDGFTGVDSLITDLTVKYKKRYTDNTFISKYTSSTDFDEAENYTDQERKATINAETIRDETTSIILNNGCKNFYRIPLRKIVLYCNPENTMTLVPGRKVTFASNTYIPNVYDTVFVITETNFQPGYGNKQPEVVLTLIQYPTEISVPILYQDADTGIVIQDADGSVLKYQM